MMRREAQAHEKLHPGIPYFWLMECATLLTAETKGAKCGHDFISTNGRTDAYTQKHHNTQGTRGMKLLQLLGPSWYSSLQPCASVPKFCRCQLSCAITTLASRHPERDTEERKPVEHEWKAKEAVSVLGWNTRSKKATPSRIHVQTSSPFASSPSFILCFSLRRVPPKPLEKGWHMRVE